MGSIDISQLISQLLAALQSIVASFSGDENSSIIRAIADFLGSIVGSDK